MAPQGPNAVPPEPQRKRCGWAPGNGRRPTWHRAAPGAVRGHSHPDPTAMGHGGGGGWEPHGMAQTLQMTAERRTRGRAQRTPAEPPYRQRVGTAPPRPAPYLGVKVALPAVSAVPAGGGERR